jgi:hypothetical protein
MNNRASEVFLRIAEPNMLVNVTELAAFCGCEYLWG